MKNFTSIRVKLIRSIMTMMVVIFCVVLAVIVGLNWLSASKNIKAAEQTIRNAIIAKGKLLAGNNSIAMQDPASASGFMQITQIVTSTVDGDADIVYGIYMDNTMLPWVNYKKGETPSSDAPVPLTDSMAQWASKLTAPSNRTCKIKHDEVYEFAAPVQVSGETLGFIRYGVSTRAMHEAIKEARIQGLISLGIAVGVLIALFAGSLFIGFGLLRTIASRITNPLASLVRSARTIGEGNYDTVVKPESDDEIGALAEDFELMRQTVKRFTDHLQDLVDEKMQQVNDILNNIDQGLFTINLDGTVNKEYSARANDILKVDDVSSRSINELFRLDTRQEEAFRQWLNLIADRHESQRWHKLVRLAPVLELELGTEDRPAAEQMMAFVSVSYQKVFDKQGQLAKIMVLAVDETEKRLKDLQMKQERERHENEVKAILGITNTPPDEMAEFIEDTEMRLVRVGAVVSELHEGVVRQRNDHPDGESCDVTPSQIDSLYRDIHTVKGNGGSYGFELLSSYAHRAEDALEELRRPVITRRGDILARMLEQHGNMMEQLTDIKAKVQMIFGKEEDSVVLVPETRVAHINTICTTLGTGIDAAKVRELVRECGMLSWKPLKSLARKYAKIVQQASRKTGKSVTFVVENDKQMFPPGALSAIDEALVHVVRNAVDHGIEPDEARSEAGKGAGSVSFRFAMSEGVAEVHIADDGKGIDTDRIVVSAVTKGLITEEEAGRMTRDEKLMLIFRPGFSTAEAVTDISGRGVGMDIVKSRMDQLGGTIEIETTVGRGTEIILRYPIV